MKANLTSDIPIERASNNYHADENRSLIHEPNGEPEARTLEYFKNVNKSAIFRLYNFYKLDFELFNYNLHGLED